MANDGPPDGYVTSAEACERLGISDRTLRRRVQAGTIEGEYIPRPQGSMLYVKLTGDAAVQTAAGGKSRKSEETAEESRGNAAPPDTRQDAALLALLERLDGKDAALLVSTERAARAEAERDAARQAAETASAQAADLAARLAAAEAQRVALQADRDRLAAEVTRRRWWRFWE